MIKLHNITKSYRLGGTSFDVLKDVTLTVGTNEMAAIMGPSGAGKTTLMNIIGLLDRPTRGTYHLNDVAVETLLPDEVAAQRNRSIGFVFQSFFLLPRMTALQNVMLPLMYRGVPMVDRRSRAQEALDRVKVGQFSKNRPTELSGGQQQRVAIARAVVGKPDIILADEPTGALDTKTGQEVMGLLHELNQSEGTTILVITHDPSIGKQCGRIIHMCDGKVLEDD